MFALVYYVVNIGTKLVNLAYVTRVAKKGSYTRTVSRHTFHCHLLVISMHQQHMCLMLLKVEQSVFTQASFQACLVSTSAWVAFKWFCLPLASRQPGCESPYDCLMSLAMDLATLCDVWR